METPQKRLESIFGEAIEIEPGVRGSQYVDRACGDDADLRSAVESLLSAHDRAGRFLESSQPAQSLDAEPENAEIRPSTTIGAYRLGDKIGEGGMGVVYAVEQSEPLRRRAAIKIIKPAITSRDVMVRFYAERRVLAMMDHPNIARVFDAGMTENGRPYGPFQQICNTQGAG